MTNEGQGDLVVRHAVGILTGLDGAAERTSGDIRIRDGRIVAIGEIPAQAGDRIIDASNCVVTPGLISTHHHLFQSVLKGLGSAIDAGLSDWLARVPYRYWHRLSGEALEVAAEIGIAELLLSGCTTVADHHTMFADSYDFDVAATLFGVAERRGMRMVLARGGSTLSRHSDDPDSRGFEGERPDVMIRRIADLADKYHDAGDAAMGRIVVAPSTSLFSVLPDHLRALGQAAIDLKLRRHTHLAESRGEVALSLARHGVRPVRFMADHGWLGEDVWLAHLVHVDEDEQRLLAETGTGMAHCPQSNGRLGSGVAPAPRMAALGVPVSLGVDGAASNEACDMVNEMHVAWLTHRALHGASSVRCEDVLRWTTAGGARVLGLPAIGTIAPGQVADIAVFDLNHPRYAGLHDPLIAPVACGGGATMRYVLSGGRIVVQDGRIPGLDHADLAARARAVVGKLTAAA